MTHSHRHPAPLSRQLTRHQRVRREARIARRLLEQGPRHVRQVSTAHANRSFFVRVMTGQRRFNIESFSALFQGNRLARYREERSLIAKMRRTAGRVLHPRATTMASGQAADAR